MIEEMMSQDVLLTQEPEVDLKKERKFCSGIGMNYFLFFLIANGLQLAVSALIMYFATDIAENNYGLYMMFIMMPMYVIGVPALWALCKRIPAMHLEKHNMSAGKFIVLLLMCFGVMIVGNIIGIIVNYLIALITGNPVLNAVELLMSNSNVWVNILIVGICAPIFEELMFRKFLVERMVRYGEATAVVVSGLMFGLFHGNFTQFFYATALGFFLAFVYVKTGKLKYPILIHMIINMSSTLIMPIVQKIDLEALENMMGAAELMAEGTVSTGLMNDMMSGFADMAVPLMILLIYDFVLYGMAFAGIILLILKRKQFTFKKGEITLPKGQRASVVWGNVGMILFSIACLCLFVLTIFNI